MANKIIIDCRILDGIMRTGIARHTTNLARELHLLDQESYYFMCEREQNSIYPEERHIQASLPFFNIDNAELSNKLMSLYGSLLDCELLYSPYFPIPEKREFKGVLTIHDLIPVLFPESAPGFSFFDVHVRKSIQTIDHVVTDSYSSKRDIVNYYGVDPEMVSVVYPSLDPLFIHTSDTYNQKCEFNDQTHIKYGIHSPYILSVCTVAPHKNLSRLLSAYTLFRERNKSTDISLVLVGGMGWQYQSLLQELEQHPYRKDIIMTGYVADDDLPSLYKHAEVFVFPSLYEGFGLPVLEAMACGAPVVTSNVSSLPEVGGDAATYCDPQSVESIAEAILEVVHSSSKRECYIAKGLERSKHFSYQKAASQLHDIFKRILL
jgi:glycosyltransferase involved in cell wall biosynthesis